mmetsp:Transcript_10689/g.39958  ORF Transcript_10689/g.39958 Transcript_10689/m.39958 type:complete len:442 (+) Transcript_10689:4641-5966(+)
MPQHHAHFYYPLNITSRIASNKYILFAFIVVVLTIYFFVSSFLVYKTLFVSQWHIIEPPETKLQWSNDCAVTLVTSIRAEEVKLNPMQSLFRLRTCIMIFAPRESHKQIRKQWSDISYDQDKKVHYGRLLLSDLDVEKDVKQWNLFEDVLASVQVMWRLKYLSVEEQEAVAIDKALLLLKPSFLERSKNEDPFKSKYFFWIDSNYASDLFWEIPQGRIWPDSSKVHAMLKKKNTLFMINMQDQNVLTQYCEESQSARAHDISSIAPGFFGGNKEAIQDLHSFFENVSKQSLKNRLLSDEQTLLHLVWCQKPSLFLLYKCPVAGICHILGQHPCWDSYTCPAYMLQESYHEVHMDPVPGALKLYVTGRAGEWGRSVLRGIVLLFFIICVLIPGVALFVRKWWWGQRLGPTAYMQMPDLYALDHASTSEEEMTTDTPLEDGWR